MKFQLGDRVRFIDEYGEGVVVRIISDTMLCIDIDEGIDIPVHEGELILIERNGEIIQDIVEDDVEDDLLFDEEEIQEEEEDVDLSILKQADFSKKHSEQKTIINLDDHAQSLSLKIVDLHIEKLVSDFKYLSNSEMLAIQISEFEKLMDEGILGRYKRIVFIHGVGNGILKKEILSRLSTSKDVRYGDASELEFGYGATEVSFL